MSLLFVILPLAAGIVLSGVAVYQSWSDGVIAGYAGDPCDPIHSPTLRALWIAGYAYGAQARLLERDARRAARAGGCAMITGQQVYNAGFPGREKDWPKLRDGQRRFWEHLGARISAPVTSPLLPGPEMVEWLQVRLDYLERAPGMWGSAESIEFVALLLIEARQAIVRPKAHIANPYETREAYMHFVRAVNGESTNTFLHCILREEGRLAELPKLIGDYGRWVAREYPPEAA